MHAIWGWDIPHPQVLGNCIRSINTKTPQNICVYIYIYSVVFLWSSGGDVPLNVGWIWWLLLLIDTKQPVRHESVQRTTMQNKAEQSLRNTNCTMIQSVHVCSRYLCARVKQSTHMWNNHCTKQSVHVWNNQPETVDTLWFSLSRMATD